ncbi:alpha-mannosidase [Lentibacillus daqui]|uniref:alpha-mannosidase n=1 Tax=Lentibacillus daqui TaxID=2911514 RepID=UPI0022B0BE62|nr:alpha-mannosidase [Lentibacillus daqui]
MSNKKTVHIISHTHWDREWYLPYEKHHVGLIKLMDQLIETLEQQLDYRSFHLDGQTIILDDYLQVRPEMRDKVQQLINDGRLQIGPWYILQDEFLTSGEVNIRNLQYGMKDAKAWGSLAKVGYFPDSFGNIGQAPQILRQAGIGHAVFGRGVKPTGFNNMVADTDVFETPYSEMVWRSPDGSTVLGMLFANWYCNGNEIPVNTKEAKIYWDDRLASMEKYAATPNMLMMNGCDHQPIQTDLPEAIQTAERLFPEITFVHSNFNAYVNDLKSSLPDDLKTIDGELRSQQTDGWGTLVNTASSRLYLKQMNYLGETLLEKVAEPLATFAYMLGADYDRDLFEYAWKTLMQNHPHDSICGCSVDEVHREMVTRFAKSKDVTQSLVDDSLSYIQAHVDTTIFEKYGKDTLPFTVFNTTGQNRTGIISVVLDVKREYFAAGVIKDQLKTFPLGDKVIVDAEGNTFDCQVEDLGIQFDYDLPKDRFRQPYMSRRIKITFQAKDVPALGLKTYACITGTDSRAELGQTLITGDKVMENDHVHVQIEDNGSLILTDKVNGHVYHDICVYEDTGDIGNEYMYKQPTNDTALTTKHVSAKVKLVTNTSFQATYQISHDWELPASATPLLEQEQQELVVFTERKAERSTEKIPFRITTMVTLTRDSNGVEVETSFYNRSKDHRLRVLFPTDLSSSTHAADSVFEVANRTNVPADGWTNPDYSQHQQAFVDAGDETAGLTIANHGLTEYELLRDGRQTIALTLLRSVGELGDWGYFPTPEAQCLGDHTVSFKIIPHQGKESRLKSYQDAYQYQVPWSVKQVNIQKADVPPVYSFIEQNIISNRLVFSSMKVALSSTDVMLRWFNITDRETILDLRVPNGIQEVYQSNIIEEKRMPIWEVNEGVKLPVKKYEITTIGLKK